MPSERITDEKLKEWVKIRKQISKLQKREEVLRKTVEREMRLKKVNSLNTRNYITARRLLKREIIRRKNVPSSVWDRYAEDVEYYTYTVFKK